ncbi:hypothetical protein B5X24_HaOG200727 [Helicoverpa armigera]|uniref:Gustatory receptor n=1 Tax=Helicoverpa armigera TaxID=29058 RepID=A0A2W1BV58_HELAM|nr:hypothetical protein B5X24_HaOG200727 [Helicoverpa armigera]
METLPLSNAPKSSFSSNVIDKDVQAIFYPLNVMSVLLLHPKYVIKNNKITPLSNVIKIFSACVTTLYLCQHAHKFFSVVLDDNIRRIQPVSYLYYATGSDLLFLTWGFIMNCAGNIIYTKKYVAFILKFQESHRFLGSACFKRFIIVNWLSIISMFGYFISSCIYTYFTFFHPPWGTIFHMMVLANLDADAVYACRLILLISEQFIQWNERALLLKENGEDKDYCRKMFETYGQILKCYKIYRNTMQFMVSRILGFLMIISCL